MDFQKIFALIGIALIVLEVGVPGFVLLPIGIGFLIAAAFVSALASVASQFVFLAVSIVLSYFVFAKFITPKFAQNKHLSAVDGLVGQRAKVEEKINNSEQTGYIKVYGDHWRSLTEDESVIEAGEFVVITKVDGNKVFVRRS